MGAEINAEIVETVREVLDMALGEFIFPLGVSVIGTILTNRRLKKKERIDKAPRLKAIVLDTPEKFTANHGTLKKCSEFIVFSMHLHEGMEESKDGYIVPEYHDKTNNYGLVCPLSNLPDEIRGEVSGRAVKYRLTPHSGMVNPKISNQRKHKKKSRSEFSFE